MKKKIKEALMKEYKIKSVEGNSYGEGFFDCLEMMDKKIELIYTKIYAKEIGILK